MIGLDTAPPLLVLPVCFAWGVALGLAYFRALRRTADLIVGGGHPLLGLALTLGRLALLGAGFYVAVLPGGLALLAALAGLLCAKASLLRPSRSESA